MDTAAGSPRPRRSHRAAADWRRGLDHAVELAHESGVLRGFIEPQRFSIVDHQVQVTLKVIPALLAGCTCVLKPSELSPLSSMLFAQLVHDAGCVHFAFFKTEFRESN